MARRQGNRGWTWALAVVAAVTLAIGSAALAPLPALPRERTYVIPKGTAALSAAGKDPQALPGRIRLLLDVQDVLVLRNEDDADQRIGPVLLAAGQTYRVPFKQVMEVPLSCSAHKSGQITILVEKAPGPGWARLRWRINRIFDG